MPGRDLFGFTIFPLHQCQLVQLQVPGLCTFLISHPAALDAIHLAVYFLTFETIYAYHHLTHHLALPITVVTPGSQVSMTSSLSSQFAVFLVSVFICVTLIFSKGTPQILIIPAPSSNFSKHFLAMFTENIGLLGSENFCLLCSVIFQVSCQSSLSLLTFRKLFGAGVPCVYTALYVVEIQPLTWNSRCCGQINSKSQ